MIDNKLSFFFKHQIWHVGGTIVLFYIGAQFANLQSNTNTFIKISALGWFMIAMSVPIIHQVYVWICWRSELCWKSITKTIAESLDIIKTKKMIIYPLNPIVLLIDFQHNSDLQHTQTYV